jgi:CheY-like chemotaxis protein/chemotaxis signal transduction protein
MPLTLATTQAIIIKTAHETMAIPTGAIEEIVNVSPSEIKMVGEREVMVLKRRLIPLLKLSDVLGLKADIVIKRENKTVIIINLLEQRVGFLVDVLVSQEEIVVKGLGEYLRGVKHVAGATILGGGEVAVILNPADLIASAKGFTIAGVEKEIKKFQAAHILVVDDSYTTRELEKTILESFGYEVETSVDGVDALEKIKKNPFDLILTDVQMPKMNGFELTVALKRDEKFQGVPVVILTSLEKEDEKRKGIEAGADAYLVKSAFDQTTLLETIERLIG